MQNLPEKISSKSWPLTLFYFLGAGILGGHRFYLGRRRSGTWQFLLSFSALAYPPLVSQFIVITGGPSASIAVFLVLGMLGWYLLDLCLILTGAIGDEQGDPVKAQKGDFHWIWRSLLLTAFLALLQASLVYMWQQNQPGSLGILAGEEIPRYVLLMLWASST